MQLAGSFSRNISTASRLQAKVAIGSHKEKCPEYRWTHHLSLLEIFMDKCPYCGGDLGDLDPIMDKLAKDKLNGKLNFQSACCKKPLKAYSSFSMYYIDTVEGLPEPQFIGGA